MLMRWETRKEVLKNIGIWCVNYPKFQGGFIWDFVDQAILTKDDRGRDYFAYGGDFGDRPNDGNFCGNGLLFAERTPSPKLAEIRRLYQNISFRALDAERGTIEIGNHFLLLTCRNSNSAGSKFAVENSCAARPSILLWPRGKRGCWSWSSTGSAGRNAI